MISKQEEIFYILQDIRLGELSEYEATLKLQKLGVVIKRDELPIITKNGYYRLVEPLIKEA